MPTRDLGSLTKEPPLATLDATIRGIRPGMPYDQLLEYGRRHTHKDAPGLVRKRFLLLDDEHQIVYDRFLSLVAAEGLETPRARKVMYFVWAFRDERLRRFVCERIANRQGKWRASELTRKTNADFFKQWFQPSTVKKVRSNIENYFAEMGIFDRETRTIHLELDDGWLPAAMQVAAQYERNASRRRVMLSAPVQFLISQDWHGLVNATVDELLPLDRRVSVEPEPLEDTEIEVGPAALAAARRWQPRRPTTSARSSTTVFFNHVARERANAWHQMLEQLLADAARANSYDPQYNANIDMYFASASGTVLAEMKSCHQNNLHIQVRRGVSQLLEYRFYYRDVLTAPVTLALIIETPPSSGKRWLVECLESLGILLAWKEPPADRIVTTATIPPSLSGVVLPSS